MPSGAELNHRILERYILTGERIVVATRHHWGKILEPVATALAGFVVVGFVAGLAGGTLAPVVTVLWIGWLLLAARTGWLVLQWRNEWFVATDKRLLLVYGLITHKVAMMPLRKVTDMNYARSPLGRVLGYGTFLLESAGQEQAMRNINWVSHPDATYRKLCDTLFGPDGVDPDDGPVPDDAQEEPDVIDPNLVESPWAPPSAGASPDRRLPPVPFPPVPAPPRPGAAPPAVLPAARREGRASGPTLPLPTGAWAFRGADGGVSGDGGPGEDPTPEPGDERGWTVSDEVRAPFVHVAPPPVGRHRADGEG